MQSPGDAELAAYVAAFAARQRSPQLTALVAALASLADATDSVADAVRRHDHAALLESNERAGALVDEMNERSRGLTDDDRAHFDEAGVTALCERLAAGARRNAFLIETAWAVDAEQMRLLAGLGRMAADGGLNQLSGYATPASPAYVDRQA